MVNVERDIEQISRPYHHILPTPHFGFIIPPNQSDWGRGMTTGFKQQLSPRNDQDMRIVGFFGVDMPLQHVAFVKNEVITLNPAAVLNKKPAHAKP